MTFALLALMTLAQADDTMIVDTRGGDEHARACEVEVLRFRGFQEVEGGTSLATFIPKRTTLADASPIYMVDFDQVDHTLAQAQQELLSSLRAMGLEVEEVKDLAVPEDVPCPGECAAERVVATVGGQSVLREALRIRRPDGLYVISASVRTRAELDHTGLMDFARHVRLHCKED